MSTASPTLTTAAPVQAKQNAAPSLQRACACGQHTHGAGECADCQKKREGTLQRSATANGPGVAPPIVHDVLRSSGQPLDDQTRAFMEPRFGRDFSGVRVHTGGQAAESARAVNALAYTVGRAVVFGTGQYAPRTSTGQRLMAHELTHVVQQDNSSADRGAIQRLSVSPAGDQFEQEAERVSDTILDERAIAAKTRTAPTIQRRAAPYLKKITVHLASPQNADLEWEGTAPDSAPGSDHFTISTGKGYSNPEDPAGTCTRTCCTDALTQCAPPWNQPGRVGACCTYHGDTYWAGTPLDEHNGWQWWTPIQPYYSQRGIALHQHTEVTGQPIGHGCVRMDEPNAKRIHDFSNGKNTNVTIDGRAAPVACEENRRCAGSTAGVRGELESADPTTQLAMNMQEPVPGLEGELT